jgi:L-threonylcarbamoyladenylate synthase
MHHVALAVIIHQGRILVEYLTPEVRNEFRGVPVVLPGGRVQEDIDPAIAVCEQVKRDTGLRVEVDELIAVREHPLLPDSIFTYYRCRVIGSARARILNKRKVRRLIWVDLAAAAALMLTLYTRVLAYMIRQFYGSSLPSGARLPELSWLQQDLEIYAERLRAGELVAFPTETVYGLGANAFDEDAVAKIFEVKKRPADNPLIVHVPSLEALGSVTERLDTLSEMLLQAFTPGPLTVILPKSKRIPTIVTAGSSNVAVRIPANMFALELLSAASIPIAAPSANRSGKPSATHHKHVADSFGNDVTNIVRAGKTTLGLESTVVIPKNDEQIVILRQGAISREELQAKFPTYEVVIAGTVDTKATPSPGLRHRHYAPNARIAIVPNSPKAKMVSEITTRYKASIKLGLRVRVLCSQELATLLPATVKVLILGSEKTLAEIGQNLYDALLECDAQKIDFILIQSFSEKGIGRTVMERIRRASEPSVN